MKDRTLRNGMPKEAEYLTEFLKKIKATDIKAGRKWTSFNYKDKNLPLAEYHISGLVGAGDRHTADVYFLEQCYNNFLEMKK